MRGFWNQVGFFRLWEVVDVRGGVDKTVWILTLARGESDASKQGRAVLCDEIERGDLVRVSSDQNKTFNRVGQSVANHLRAQGSGKLFKQDSRLQVRVSSRKYPSMISTPLARNASQ